jgi:hypothetical protein
MLKVLHAFFIFLCLAQVAQAQQEIPLVFQGCETSENPEGCSLLKLAQIISREVPVGELPYDLKENEELMLSIVLIFQPNGHVRLDRAVIFNADKQTYKEFELVLKKIPLTISAVENGDNDRLIGFKSYMIFQNRENRLTIKKISKEWPENKKPPSKPPIFKGCKEKWSNERINKCYKSKFTDYFTSNFEMKNLDSSFFLEGEIIKVMAEVYFKNDGTIAVREFDTPHPSLYEEFKRVALNYKGYIKPGHIGLKPVGTIIKIPLNVEYKK